MSSRQHLTAIKYEYQNKDGQGYCKSGSTVDSLTIQLVRSPNSRVTSRTSKVIILQLLRYMTEYRSWVVTVAPYYLPCKYSRTILGHPSAIRSASTIQILQKKKSAVFPVTVFGCILRNTFIQHFLSCFKSTTNSSQNIYSFEPLTIDKCCTFSPCV